MTLSQIQNKRNEIVREINACVSRTLTVPTSSNIQQMNVRLRELNNELVLLNKNLNTLTEKEMAL